ncbi:hypothetical protein [Streptomyces olivochromogenes]|uniref:hypothetical protein n=1 Tax=Streptomyces olivochromogenes TaxID=1963 RepID=UPI000AB1FB02|nr:hypothetical protein [Streptomyces olivochromogenes]
MTVTVMTDHQLVDVFEDRKRCTACGVVAVRQYNPQSRSDAKVWTDWRAPDGRTWLTTPDGYIQPPSCPLPAVEALCPWEDRAMRYAGPKGDVQLATAMATWCERHEMAVADCPEPGPYCPGALAHEDGEEGRPGPCTGRENSCKCMCSACCGDDPHTWGYDGPF